MLQVKSTKEIEYAITKARIGMLITFPFWGQLALRLQPKDGSKWTKRCSTDGRYLYYNAEFFSRLTNDQMIWTIAHLIGHCVYEHLDRRGSRDADRWDISSDLMINYELYRAKVGAMPIFDDCEPAFDNRFAELSTPEIFTILDKEDSKKGGGSGTGAGGGSKQYQQFDEHVDPDKSNDPSEDGSDGPVYMSEDDRQQLSNDMMQAIIDAAKSSMSSGASKDSAVPPRLRSLIKDLTEPTMDWREMLNSCVQSTFKNDYSFSIPNRRSAHLPVILPGLMPDVRINVDIAIDTSGSISGKMIKDFLSEIHGIMTQFNDFQVSVWTFDHNIHNRQIFTPENIYDLEQYEVMGGGGTVFTINWDFMKDNDILPHQFIMMTDGECWGDAWGDPDYCETIFLIHGNKNIVAPFGQTLYYEYDER